MVALVDKLMGPRHNSAFTFFIESVCVRVCVCAYVHPCMLVHRCGYRRVCVCMREREGGRLCLNVSCCPFDNRNDSRKRKLKEPIERSTLPLL